MPRTEANAARLTQLSEQLGRIATLLTHLLGDASFENWQAGSPADIPEIPGEFVESIIKARRMRSRFFPKDLFADPAWDMMLELLGAEIAQRRVTVSNLCMAAEVPATTALRWLKIIIDRGMAMRRPDPLDARRVYVELRADTSRALRRYFAEIMHA